MGAETLGYIKNNYITFEDIYDVICDTYDENSKLLINDDMTCKIKFTDGDDQRELFISVAEDNENYVLSLGYWGNSVDIINNIISVLGGSIIECDYNYN